MRGLAVPAFVFLLACFAFSTQSATPPKTNQDKQTADPDSALKEMFAAKIKLEWEALKNKDKKAYGELLADDYLGVEIDARGERNKIQSINEVSNLNVSNYNLWGFKLIPLGSDAAFVIYEVTIQFPPKSVMRYSRVYITELWIKRVGQWQEVHYQETQVK